MGKGPSDCYLSSLYIYIYRSFHKWGCPKIVGLYWNSHSKGWFGGSPILGKRHIYIYTEREGIHLSNLIVSLIYFIISSYFSDDFDCIVGLLTGYIKPGAKGKGHLHGLPVYLGLPIIGSNRQTDRRYMKVYWGLPYFHTDYEMISIDVIWYPMLVRLVSSSSPKLYKLHSKVFFASWRLPMSDEERNT